MLDHFQHMILVLIGYRCPEKQLQIFFQSEINHQFNRIPVLMSSHFCQRRLVIDHVIHHEHVVPIGRSQFSADNTGPLVFTTRDLNKLCSQVTVAAQTCALLSQWQLTKV